jgi:hypothetical protein
MRITRHSLAVRFFFAWISSWLLVQFTSTQAYTPEAEKFDPPSLSIRGALKAAIDHDYEDVIVMQTEMAWGAQEMQRYRSIKGEWPVRSSVPQGKQDLDHGAPGHFRRSEPPPTNEDGEGDYWTYLISMF